MVKSKISNSRNNPKFNTAIRVAKFTFEKGGFIRFAFDSKKRIGKSIFKKIESKDKKLELFELTARFFLKIIKEFELKSKRKSFDYNLFFYRKLNLYYNLLLKGNLVNEQKNKEYAYWSYLAKSFNILMFNLVSQNEIVDSRSYQRLKKLIHVPIDSTVMIELLKRINSNRIPKKLKRLLLDRINMLYFKSDFKKGSLMAVNSKCKYYSIQETIAIVQQFYKESPIDIEQAYGRQ